MHCMQVMWSKKSILLETRHHIFNELPNRNMSSKQVKEQIINDVTFGPTWCLARTVT